MSGERPVYGFTSVPLRGRAPSRTLDTRHESLYVFHRGLVYAFERTDDYPVEAGKMEYESWGNYAASSPQESK